MQPLPEAEDFSDLHGKRKGCTVPLVEHRGMTVFQIGDIMRHIRRRCNREGWTNILNLKLEHDTVTLYDATRFIIRPATYERSCSYMELVSRKAQIPGWYVCHWWGEPVKHFLDCLNAHCDDRNLNRAEKPYWICA